jgi:hypothetical protein
MSPSCAPFWTDDIARKRPFDHSLFCNSRSGFLLQSTTTYRLVVICALAVTWVMVPQEEHFLDPWRAILRPRLGNRSIYDRSSPHECGKELICTFNPFAPWTLCVDLAYCGRNCGRGNPKNDDCDGIFSRLLAGTFTSRSGAYRAVSNVTFTCC